MLILGSFSIKPKIYKFFSLTSYLERLSTVEVQRLSVPQVSLVSIFCPEQGASACSCGPQVHCQAEHMTPKHAVMEAENTLAGVGKGWVFSRLVGGFKDWTQQHSRVFKLLRGRRLDVKVVAVPRAQCVVFKGACIKSWSWAINVSPVKVISSFGFLFPVAQPFFKVTLKFWSCDKQGDAEAQKHITVTDSLIKVNQWFKMFGWDSNVSQIRPSVFISMSAILNTITFK